MKWNNVHSIDNVRKWVEAHPSHVGTSAMQGMLIDMDKFGEEYTMDDFDDEMDYQMADHAGGLDPDELAA